MECLCVRVCAWVCGGKMKEVKIGGRVVVLDEI